MSDEQLLFKSTLGNVFGGRLYKNVMSWVVGLLRTATQRDSSLIVLIVTLQKLIKKPHKNLKTYAILVYGHQYGHIRKRK